MPRATVDISDTKQFDLKTLAGGQITLRRLSYGEWLERQAMAMDFSMTGNGPDNMEMKMNAAQLKVTTFEFQRCIVTHNLEDHDGNLLDFAKKAGMCLSLLDPRVGQEIASLINDMNSAESVLGNSET